MLNKAIHTTTRLMAVSIIAGALLTGLVPEVSAQGSDEAVAVQKSEARPDNLPAVFDGVGIDEQLGTTLPLSLVFQDESGADVALEGYFNRDRPVILNFAYHNCPMLCSVMLESFATTLHDLELGVGEEFDVVTVSFSAIETPDLAARQKERYLETVDRPSAEEGWHFLTGTEENIQALAAATGFNFKWIESSQEYAHPAALIFLSEEGVVTRYLHGMAFPTVDVRRAIVEASRGEIGTAMDRIIMYCFRYDASANSYVIHAQNLMKIAGLLTLLVMGLILSVFWRRERDRNEKSAHAKHVSATEFG